MFVIHLFLKRKYFFDMFSFWEYFKQGNYIYIKNMQILSVYIVNVIFSNNSCNGLDTTTSS